jgi:hypothetical protein
VIGEVSLNVAWQIASGFRFAGKGLSPTAHCASPPGKLRAFVKSEFSCGGFHTTVSHQSVHIAIYLMRAGAELYGKQTGHIMTASEASAHD